MLLRLHQPTPTNLWVGFALDFAFGGERFKRSLGAPHLLLRRYGMFHSHTRALSSISPSLIALGLVVLLLPACGRSLYVLPPAPPESEWVDLNAPPEVDAQVELKRFFEARSVASKTYVALVNGDWDVAIANMSQETRNMLELMSDGKGATATLAKGVLMRQDGQAFKFDPAADFFLPNLQNFKDTIPNVPPEAENDKRKEIYAINGNGQARKLVFIFEEDAWRFHSPFLGSEIYKVEP